MSLVIYHFDCESSGLNSITQEVTELGIIRDLDRMQLWRNVKCETPWTCSADALKITNKTIEDLSNGHSKENVVAEANKFINEDGLTRAHRVACAHNASFDRRFLHALWSKCGLEFPIDNWIDTIPMVKEYAKQQGIVKPKVNLQAACDLVGIKKFSAQHNAKVDSRNLYLLYRDLVDNKKIDYLPFIKTHIHTLIEEECGLNPDDLDIE